MPGVVKGALELNGSKTTNDILKVVFVYHFENIVPCQLYHITDTSYFLHTKSNASAPEHNLETVCKLGRNIQLFLLPGSPSAVFSSRIEGQIDLISTLIPPHQCQRH